MTPTLALAAALTQSAAGSFSTGDPFTLSTRSEVSVEFVSQSAGWTGSLYFMGAETPDTFAPAPDSDSNNLGMFILSNHGAAAGDGATLGTFDTGAVLHFAYFITRGGHKNRSHPHNLFRTTHAPDLDYFALEPMPGRDGAQVTRMRIEDIKPRGRSDMDFNDVVVDVITRPVPTPAGTGAFIAAAGLAACSRRRRQRAAS